MAGIMHRLAEKAKPIMAEPNFKLSLTVDLFATDNSIDSSVTASIVYAIYMECKDLTEGKDDAATFNADDCLHSGLTEDQKTIFRNAFDNTKTHAVQLLVGATGGKLKVRNVKSYFEMAGQKLTNYDVLHEVVVFYANFFRGNFSEEDMAVIMKSSKWLQYRLKKFSSASICLRFAQAHPAAFATFDNIDLERLEHIEATSYNVTASDEIPEDLIATAALFMKSAGVFPDGWYQGNRALDMMNPNRIIMWKEYFKASKDIIRVPDDLMEYVNDNSDLLDIVGLGDHAAEPAPRARKKAADRKREFKNNVRRFVAEGMSHEDAISAARDFE